MGRPALNIVASRDPSRAALADAIADVSAQEVTLAQAVEVRDRVSASGTEAFLEVEAAEEEIRVAKATQRDEIMASVMRGDDTPSNTRLAKAEERLAVAEQRRAALREAFEETKAAVSAQEQRVASAQAHMRECRTAVLWDALPALVAAALPLREELREYAEAISLITQSSPIAMPYDDPRRGVEDEARRVMEPIMAVASGIAPPAVAIAEWKAAIARLGTDPDAPLPSGV